MHCLLFFQRKMRFDLKKFFCVLAILGFVYAFTCFSYEADTWYTDFDFWLYGSMMEITLSGWETRNVDFYLKNNSSSTISGYFATVDAFELQPDVFVCAAEWQNEDVWQYITISSTTFFLNPFEIFTGSASVRFPEYYDDDHYGCIVYIPDWDEQSWNINTVPRKAIFIRATLNATAIEYQVKVFPGSRSKPSLANVWEIRFYKWNQLKYSASVSSDADWFGVFSGIIPSGLYTVVYKWQSHLASYLTDVHVGSWYSTGFDFTTWTNLVWVQNYTNSTDNWFRYQIAWDLESDLWVYDFTINSTDISIVTKSWFLDNMFGDPRDLNGDWKISVDDLAVIWANFDQNDEFFAENAFNGLWYFN